MLELPQQFGKYVLQERIAIGGMAEIFRAHAPGLGGFEKELAIKRLHPRYSDDQDFIRMLVDEARIAVQLSHSNIGQIFDLDREEGLVYIAMEFIDGRDLYRVLKRMAEHDGSLPIEAAVFVAMEMCAGLDYAHRKTMVDGTPLEIIHRDISPQNILVSWEGEVKIVDFGIAKAAMRAFETESGVIKGKFYYMSPEQARGDQLDNRTDIFSTGICLYEMLTGATLYREEDDVTLLSRVRRAEIDPPTSIRADIPLDLERIVMKALARDPRRRYQSAHRFQMALSSFLYSLGRPYSRVQLGHLVRDLFKVDQPHPDLDVEVAYHDRFISRVDYLENGSSLSSSLLAGASTAIVSPRPEVIPAVPNQIQVALAHRGDGVYAHDPYAESTLFESGEFEEGPTRAEPTPFADAAEGAMTVYPAHAVDLDDDEETLALPRKDIRAALAGLAAGGNADAILGAAALTGRLPETSPFPGPIPGPVPPHADPALAQIEEMPSSEYQLDMHTGMVTGVYNEPTRITPLEKGAGAQGPAQGVIVRDSVFQPALKVGQVPLVYKGLFAVGLAVILLLGGAISTLAAVLIDKAGAPATPGDSAIAAVDGPRAAPTADPVAAVAPAAPAPRSMEILVAGPESAAVTMGGKRLDTVSSRAAFTDLAVDTAYTLDVTAPNWAPYQSEFVLAADTPSPLQVQLLPRVGQLEIISDPPGATITVGEKVFAAPTPATLRELPRTKAYEIRLELEGYESWTEGVDWDDAERDLKKLEVRLVKLGSEPVAALDPLAVGEDPLAVAAPESPSGASPAVAKAKPTRAEARAAERKREARREARLEKERRRKERDRDRLAARDRDRRKPKVAASAGGSGFISVNARPWGQVWVDGRRAANETPLIRYRVSSGYHTVTVKFPTLGGRKKTKRVFVKPGGSAKVFVTP
jgi:serine/threonine protein kinase